MPWLILKSMSRNCSLFEQFLLSVGYVDFSITGTVLAKSSTLSCKEEDGVELSLALKLTFEQGEVRVIVLSISSALDFSDFSFKIAARGDFFSFKASRKVSLAEYLKNCHQRTVFLRDWTFFG